MCGPVVFGSMNRGMSKGVYFGAPVEMGIGMRGVQKECVFVAPCR